MRIVIQPDSDAVCAWAAASIVLAIRSFKPEPGRPFVLGLPTGSTPIGMYRELVRFHREGVVSFENVATFNMDEYIGLPADDPRSYHAYMREHFHGHVDMHAGNIHIPDGNAPDLDRECAEYERAIARLGGVELFVGGLGSDGHIAFNEPGSALAGRTRVTALAPKTIADNARFFGGDPEAVPRSAITVGMGTVMDARTVMILAAGSAKAAALRPGVEEGVCHLRPLSALQLHPRAIVVCDEAAASALDPGTVRAFRDHEILERDPRDLLERRN